MKDKEYKNNISNLPPQKIETEGVKTLLGEPKKAIIKLAIPLIIAMSVQTLYNLVDAFWVSGLGADALAAIGFVFPFYFMIIALSSGLGVGVGSAISRKIGARDKEVADNVAVHSIIIMLLLTVVVSIPLFVFAGDIFVLIGAGKTAGMAAAYGSVIFAGGIFIFFSHTANSILRSEGDVKRAMYALMLGAGLNIVLDPIFIYTLNMGVAGAAWATVISLSVTSILMANWLFLKKDTYVSFNFSNFKFNKNIVKDIFGVGLPASVSQLSMALTMVIINVMIVMVGVGSTDGVAVYTTGWRVAMIAILPLLGIATAVVSVSGAAFGAKSFEKLKVSHLYAVKIGIVIEAVIAAATFIFAPQIAAVFTQSEGAAHIASDLTFFLRVMCIFYPAVSLGMLSASVFQGTGKGINALLVTTLRTLILTPLFVVVLAFSFNIGLIGIWLGIVAANIIGSVVAFSWARRYIVKLLRPTP
ncbi:MAG: MATE family efflux transporter [Candidatus Aminicenantes bacterium]|nr:MATE family efflux transporter [Candidatus Aminicenantes bacterium]